MWRTILGTKRTICFCTEMSLINATYESYQHFALCMVAYLFLTLSCQHRKEQLCRRKSQTKIKVHQTKLEQKINAWMLVQRRCFRYIARFSPPKKQANGFHLLSHHRSRRSLSWKSKTTHAEPSCSDSNTATTRRRKNNLRTQDPRKSKNH